MNILMQCAVTRSAVASLESFIDGIIRVELEEQNRSLRRHMKLPERRARGRLMFRQMTDRHFTAMRLADASFDLLRRSADSLHEIDAVIGRVKQAGKSFRKEKDCMRSDECTELVGRLASVYFRIRDERNILLGRTRELNRKTGRLRDEIARGCGKRGQAWAVGRLGKRKA